MRIVIMINSPFGSDELDITEDTSAERVGRRIRTIRTAKGLSQGELGEMVGLNADRIQKYENGARKPKSELLKNIAKALEVSPLALADPTISGYINSMFALFELEDNYDMKLEKIDTDGKGLRLGLTVNFKEGFYKYMEEWYEIYSKTKTELELATTDEEHEEILKSYREWKWKFPQGLVDKTSKEMQKICIKNKIEELQKVYEKFDVKIDEE